jgi:hypothetical protein
VVRTTAKPSWGHSLGDLAVDGIETYEFPERIVNSPIISDRTPEGGRDSTEDSEKDNDMHPEGISG